MGIWDLVTGAWGSNQEAGAVHILYGSDAGLTAAGDQLWTLDSPGVKGTSRRPEGHRFGASLATGNFNGDKFPTSPLAAKATTSPQAQSTSSMRSRRG